MQPKALHHFKKVDPQLHKIYLKVGEISKLLAKPKESYFYDLCDSIISQQLSIKAANTIMARLVQLMPNQILTPKAVLSLPDEAIRQTGISAAKIKYLKGLSQNIIEQNITLEELETLQDDEVKNKLIQVKGIGTWTAEMFLMFTLGRPDVFSDKDLGIKKAMQKIYQIDNITSDAMQKISTPWSPYRTLACRILWKSLELI